MGIVEGKGCLTCVSSRRRVSHVPNCCRTASVYPPRSCRGFCSNRTARAWRCVPLGVWGVSPVHKSWVALCEVSISIRYAAHMASEEATSIGVAAREPGGRVYVSVGTAGGALAWGIAVECVHQLVPGLV